MRCTRPRTVGFLHDGKTLSWSFKNSSKEYPFFQLPCGKCISCRLEYSRQWAIRCMHEAQMHPQNCFITLTYSPEKLQSPKLQYRDFQLFMKSLRFKEPHLEMGLFVTGEYGDQTKRPHWHAIIFNWSPSDPVKHYVTELGHQVWTSETLTKLWPHGHSEFGSVTFDSAGYVARYAAKKLVHGKDQDHEFVPISKKSSKHAIGKRYIEEYWQTIFNNGYIVFKHRDKYIKTAIPRYYEKWLKKNHAGAWIEYATKLKTERIAKAEKKDAEEKHEEKTVNENRFGKGPQITRNKTKEKILSAKHKQALTQLKL